MIEQQLKTLGFNKNEIKVYLSLFDLGQSKAGQIIEHTKIHRNLVYTALEELTAKNIISKLEKNNIAIFEINDPIILQELLEEKISTTKNVVQELRNRLNFKPRDIRIYEGIEGLKVVRKKIVEKIQPGEEYYIMGTPNMIDDDELNEYLNKTNKKIIKKNGDIKILIENSENIQNTDELGLIPREHTRYLPFSVNSPMLISLFRDTMNISILDKNPITFSVQSQETADGFKKYFEYFWNQETQILKGTKVLKELWLEGIRCKEIRWIGARGYFVDRYPEIWQEIKSKAKKTPGTVWKNIVDIDFKGHHITKLPWMQTKYNLGEVRNPTAIWLFGDKVLIVNWAEDVPVIFQSTNKQLVQSYSDYFEELWNKK